ncbi:hypothetical protein DBR06_SOUSAS29610012, partial [Sousa chinensis]
LPLALMTLRISPLSMHKLSPFEIIMEKPM